MELQLLGLWASTLLLADFAQDVQYRRRGQSEHTAVWVVHLPDNEDRGGHREGSYYQRDEYRGVAFGAGPLRDFTGLPFSSLYSYGSAVAVVMGILAWLLVRRSSGRR